MPENKKYVELLWAEKYAKYEKGDKIPIEKPNLPLRRFLSLTGSKDLQVDE